MMTKHMPKMSATGSRRHIYFAGFVAATIILFWNTLSTLAQFSLREESSSHILLIPLVSIYLLSTERKRIFAAASAFNIPGAVLMLAGVFLHMLVISRPSAPGHFSSLPGATLSLVLIWIGGFAFFYGLRALRAAAFPLGFLLLMIPIPENLLARTIYLLQSGSTAIAYFLFRILGVP